MKITCIHDENEYANTYIQLSAALTPLTHPQERSGSIPNLEGPFPDSTTTMAQRRQRRQRRHGRRWHNYVGTTSPCMVAVGTTTLAQRHLVNVAPMSENCVGPTYFCQPYANDVGHVGKNKKSKYCSLIF